MSPEMTVLMAVHDGQQFVLEAIESLRRQTWRDFECLIVDDGSMDRTPRILLDCVGRDPRFRILQNETNIGLTRSLNRGLDQIGAELVARMDADDIAHPKRLERQLAFMRLHPEVGVCGTWVEVLGSRPRDVWMYAGHDSVIRCRLLFESALAHPTVVMRTAVVKAAGGYDPDYSTAQDYDLWVRLAPTTRLACLPEILLLRRAHSQQKSRRDRAVGLVYQATGTIRRRQLLRLGLQPNEDEMQLHMALSSGVLERSRGFVKRVGKWFEQIWSSNEHTGLYDRRALANDLAQRLYRVCLANTSHGYEAFEELWSSPFARLAHLPVRKWIGLWLRSTRRALSHPASGN